MLTTGGGGLAGIDVADNLDKVSGRSSEVKAVP